MLLDGRKIQDERGSMKTNSGTASAGIDLTVGLEKDNIYNFLKDYKIIIYIWAITAVLDAFSTNLFMMYTGPEDELNVLTRACCDLTGIYIGPYLAGVLKFVFALPFLVALKKVGSWALTLSIGGQVYAVFVNIGLYNYFSENQYFIAAWV